MNLDVIADTDRLTARVIPIPLSQAIPGPEPDDQFYRPPLEQSISSATISASLPWMPIQIPGTTLIGISPNGYVLPADGTVSKIAITGQLASTNPSPTDPGAFICPAIGGGVWLELNTDQGTDIDPSLSNGGKIMHGTLWSGHPNPNAFSGDGISLYGVTYYLLLAKIEDPSSLHPGFVIDFGGSDKRKVVQWYNQNVVMRVRNSSAALVVEPENPALLYYDA